MSKRVRKGRDSTWFLESGCGPPLKPEKEGERYLMNTLELFTELPLLPLAALIKVGSGLGGILFLIAWIWMMVIAFPDHIDWGLLVLILPGVGGLIYGIVRYPVTTRPLILLIVAMVIGGGLLLGSGPLIVR